MIKPALQLLSTSILMSVLSLQTLTVNAQSENALSFDNFDDYVIAPSASSLISGSNSISMAFWVLGSNTAPSYPDYDGFAGFRNNNDADFYILQLSASGLEARFRNSAGINYDVTFGGFQTGTPQHLALTYNGSTLTLYHNGVIAGSIAASGSISNQVENFYMGMLPWTGANFYTNGRLDEVSLWNKALTSAEVNCIFEGAINPNESNLLLYYKFNQGIAAGNNTSITSVTDSKGNINGILNNLALTGNSSNFVNGTLTGNSATITDSICPGGTYVFGNQNLTTPGIYYESFPGTGGCDSVITLNLTYSVSGINTAVTQNGITLTSQQAGATYQWLDCANGFAPIPGDTNATFTAATNGQYAVAVGLGGCSDTSACFNITSVGLQDNQMTDVAISVSNPFTNELVLSNASGNSPFVFVITDAAGKELINSSLAAGETIRITTESWSRGLYLLHQPGGRYHKKLMKTQ